MTTPKGADDPPRSGVMPAELSSTNRPLASNILFESVDVDECRYRVASVFCPHRLEPIGGNYKLDAWQTFRNVKNIGVGAMGYGADVAIEPGRLGDFYLLMLPYRGSALIDAEQRRVEASPMLGSILNPVDYVSMRWSKDCAKFMLRIERETIQHQLTLQLGKRPRAPVIFRVALERQGGGGAWWDYVGLLLRELERASHAGDPTLAAQHLENVILASLVESHAHNYSEELTGRVSRVAPRHVRLVEQYIEAHAGEPVSLEDLVRVSGVSGRALFDGFRRFRETSPMAFLRDVRLHRARDALLDACPGETVSAIAARWGFFEFGRFAGQYRSRFGESPSETLRRR